MDLKRISCPACGSSHFEHDEDNNLVCAHCGTKFDSPREEIACPACGVLNPPEAKRCMNCGLMLGQRCVACNHVNPPGADHCENCAAPLDVLETVFARARSGGRQDSMMKAELLRTKQHDEVFMQQERERLEALERERQIELAERIARSRKEQRTIAVITVIGLILMAALVISVLFLFR